MITTIPRMIEANTVAVCCGPGVVYAKLKVMQGDTLLRQVHAELSPENAMEFARDLVENSIRARCLDPL